MVLQKDIENSIDSASMQQRSLEKNGNRKNTSNQNQEMTAEISFTHNEEEFSILDLH